MAKFIVYVREVWVQGMEINAESAEKAIKDVEIGYASPTDFFEYSHILDSETWEVEEVTTLPYKYGSFSEGVS